MPPYLFGWGEWANVFVALAALSGSLYLCHFLRILPHTGHLVVIMEKMCFDVTCWLLLFLTIMLGFVSAFLVLYAQPMRSHFTTDYDDAGAGANTTSVNATGEAVRPLLKKA